MIYKKYEINKNKQQNHCSKLDLNLKTEHFVHFHKHKLKYTFFETCTYIYSVYKVLKVIEWHVSPEGELRAEKVICW